MRNLKIFTNDIEEKAKEQINLLLSQEAFENCKVRIMPDIHAGAGCVIGFTGNLGDKVIPNIVGVDIGCGMLCVELGNIDIDLVKLDEIIRKYIPSGRNVHENVNYEVTKELYCYKQLKEIDWLNKSLGTLGGGNHFIEVDKDENSNKYLVIHTGSRNLGKQVAEIYQDLAIKNCSYDNEMQEEKNKAIEYLKKEHREKEIQKSLNDITNKYQGKTKLPKDLCYLDNELREKYLHDMKICQEFAINNRLYIAKTILCIYFNVPYYNGVNSLRLVKETNYPSFISQDIIKYNFTYFETIHNYISFEDNIVRKGAISAKKDERVLIPMNMRDGCIIGIGKGNEDWNQSAPHGAGRIMSRVQAKKTFNIKEYQNSMKDIYTTSVNEDTIDEAPMVYKPMQEIIDNIKDTIEIEEIIKPIYNFKASE